MIMQRLGLWCGCQHGMRHLADILACSAWHAWTWPGPALYCSKLASSIGVATGLARHRLISRFLQCTRVHPAGAGHNMAQSHGFEHPTLLKARPESWPCLPGRAAWRRCCLYPAQCELPRILGALWQGCMAAPTGEQLAWQHVLGGCCRLW